MHHSFGLGDFVIAAGERNQLPFTAGGAQHLVDTLTVVGDEGVSCLQNRCGGAIVLLKLHHRARGFIRRLITEVVLKAHQNREVSSAEAVDALVGISHHENGTPRPVVVNLGILAIGHQQLDQVVLRAVGVLIFINQHVSEAAMPVTAHLLVLLQQLHRQQQQIIKVESVVGRQGLAVAAVHIRCELAPLTLGIGLHLIRQPALVFGIADRPAHLLGLKTLGIELQLLGDDLLDETLGIGLVINGELLRPGQSLFVLEFVDVVAQHAREQGVERADPQFLGHLAIDA